MQKVTAILIACLLVMCGCATAGVDNQSDIYQQGYDAGYAAGKSDAQAEDMTQMPKATITPAVTPVPTPTPEPEHKIGSRKRPAEIGEPIAMSYNSYNGSGEFTIVLTEVITGDDAWNMIKEANRFNDPPSDGKQYILAKFSVTFDKDTAGNDSPFEMSEYDFDFADGNYSVSTPPSIICPEPELRLKLYEGASGEGYVGFLADLSDLSPMAVLLDAAWFKLL